MSQLPSNKYLVQQIGDDVVLYHRDTEDEIVRANVYDGNALARAQKVVHDSILSDEDKCFAHFWFGYFYGAAQSNRIYMSQ